MTKLAVVGDLSGGDPARLSAVVDNALIACDYVVQVGDLHPAYEQMKSRYLTSGHKFFPVPGNHDVDYDTISCPREWVQTSADGLLTMIGVDNSTGKLTDTGKGFFAQPKATQYEFVFAHMPPCEIMLPDGAMNGHNMAEAGGQDDASWLTGELSQRGNDAMFCGHYHGWTLQETNWGRLVVDGRGGAAPDLGYTLVTIMPEGWVIHSVGV